MDFSDINFNKLLGCLLTSLYTETFLNIRTSLYLGGGSLCSCLGCKDNTAASHATALPLLTTAAHVVFYVINSYVFINRNISNN